ncbi:MAG: T9SS type A sorting domain-containing protein [Flavobacteriales bacterium]
MKNSVLVVCLLSLMGVKAQSPQVSLNLDWEVPFTFANMAMTIEPDQQGRDYMYVAGKTQGLIIYDISGTPSKIKTITKNELDTLDVMSVSQSGNYLYLSLGNSFSSGEYPGMAIVDISTPSAAVVTDIWKKYSGAKTGGGLVKVEGNYAYFGAMGDGLIIFDVTDKNNIVYKSTIVPDINYPDANPDKAKYNARGMEVRNDTIYLCYDASGLRIIDATNKLNPVQIGQYSNPALNGKPRAYNNIVLDDSLAYIAVDYAGMEILSIRQPSNIKMVGWWNQWGTANWFSSRGHANEIQYDKASKLIFMSTGKSDLNVVSVVNPSLPDSVAIFGGVDNNQGTWGLGKYHDKIYLGYIFIPLCIPFCSSWGGVKRVSWSSTTGIENPEQPSSLLYPNPSSGEITVELNSSEKGKVEVYDLMGKKVYHENFAEGSTQVNLSLEHLNSGTYVVVIRTKESVVYNKLVLED